MRQEMLQVWRDGRSMRLQNPFAAVSTTGLDSQILTVLARTEQYLTIQQIHSLLPEAGSLAGVRHPVARLVTHGTVIERKAGRTTAYALNRNHLLIGPILQIANAKQELLNRAARQISEWQLQPFIAQIFGSAARNEMETDSDIDLFLVMPDEVSPDQVDLQVDALVEQMSLWTGNDVRPLLYFASEVTQASIFESILNEGIHIYGDPSWLRKQLR